MEYIDIISSNASIQFESKPELSVCDSAERAKIPIERMCSMISIDGDDGLENGSKSIMTCDRN